MTIAAKKWFDDFVALFFPDICVSCNKEIESNKVFLCVPCQYRMAQTDHHLYQDNKFTDRLWGRLPLYSGAALYKFIEGNPIQEVLHHIKYYEREDIAFDLGKIHGKLLKKSPFFETVDFIVPVPLHWRKRIKRGYNQSEEYAKGLAESMGVIMLPNALQRNENTISQTKKSKTERLENVQNIFELKEEKLIEGKHILLVDDVLTTGATLDYCANALLLAKNVRLSMAAIAIAES